MAPVTQPLRNEHRELLPKVEVLRAAGDGVEGADALDLLSESLDFLRGHLIPHAIAEEAALYPVVEAAMQAPGSTATMTRDHVEVGRLTAALTGLKGRWRYSEADKADARRLLYGLYALVNVHFAKEEEIYLPLLDATLSQSEADEMFAAMEARAVQEKAANPGRS